jgi:hypothetical protein
MSEHKVHIALAHDFNDVAAEQQFRELNSRGFVRGATPINQWYLLVSETCKHLHIPISNHVRDYVTCMLDRFTSRTNLLDELAGFEFIPFLIGEKRVSTACIQDIADMSLQYVALFPEQNTYRHQMRSVHYVASMGEMFYQTLAKKAENKEGWFNDAYREMAKSFGSAVLLLRGLRPPTTQTHINQAEAEHVFIHDDDAAKVARNAVELSELYLKNESSETLN